MKHKVLLIITLIAFTSCSQNKTYFDSNWQETTKENAAYYRDLPIKENGLWLIHDYYITGEKQFTGQAKDSLATILEGDVTWYFKTGKVENKLRYKNGKQLGTFALFEGAIGSEEEGWNEKDLYYYDDLTKVEDAQSYVGTQFHENYYTNTSHIAKQHNEKIGYEDQFSFTLYFNRSGDTIARLNYNKTSDKWMGKEVLFYEEEKKGRNDMNSIKAISMYTEGVITEIQYFNKQEKQIAQGQLKKEKPFNGTFFKDACRFYKIQNFKNGDLIKETTYTENDKKIGELSYENEDPDTGVLYTCNSLFTYENGKLHGKFIQYFNEGAESIESEFTYKNGLKHGSYSIYQEESLLLEKGNYKNGTQKGEVLYYHNGGHSGERYNKPYYIKANVKLKKDKPFISELSQYNTDDNELIATYKLEKNNTDEFTYLDNGYTSIFTEDINNDGYNDLNITNSHFLYDIVSSTYYVFKPETNTYVHIAELDDADTVESNASEKSIKAIFRREVEGKLFSITYDFSTEKLVKKLIIEENYHAKLDSILVTQIYPAPIDKFPLLDPKLPPITFIQQNNEQQILETHQTIRLKKEPFSVTLPGLKHDDTRFGFNVKVTASYNKNVFNKVSIDEREEDTTILGVGYTFAVSANNPVIIIDDGGNNIFYYDDSNNDKLDIIKNINDKVLQLQFTIDKIQDTIKQKTISEIDKPIYMIIYMDKNQNLKIDKNEIHYLTLVFE